MREGCEDRCRTSVSGEKVDRSGGGDRSDKKDCFKDTAACGISGSGGDALCGASPKLGIISLYNGHYALISDCYINKKLVTDQEYAPDGAIAIFNPELAQIETEEAIKTAKHCYLVKYVPGGTMVNEKTGMEHPSIDHNYPVLVVASFAKNQYICLKIEADALQVRKVEQVMSTLGTAVPEQVDFDIPELCSGESVIFEMTDSTAAYHVIDSVGDDFYRINAQKFNAELG